MKKRNGPSISTMILTTVLMVGILLLLYPSISDWWNSMHASQAIATYVGAVEDLSEQKKAEMLAAAEAYNESLANGVNYDLTEEEYEEYEKVLDVSGTGIMGYVQIASIHVNLPIYHSVEEGVLQIAA